MDTCLLKLGAHKFYQRGEADEATSLELVVEPWLEGVVPAIEAEMKRLKKLPAETIKELLTPVIQPEEEGEMSESAEREAEKSKVDQINSQARVKGGRYLINTPERQIIEVEIETEREITHDLIDVGSSLSIYP